MKKNRLLSLAVAVMMALCVLLPLHSLAAKPGDVVEEKFTISAGESFYLVYVEFKLSDGLELVDVTSTLGPVIYNGATGKAIAYDANMATSGGSASVTFTVKAKIKAGVTTDQTISFSNVQYISSSLVKSGDLSNTIKIGGGLFGDVNRDGVVDLDDMMYVVRAALGLLQPGEDPTWADIVDAPNGVDLDDMMAVVRAALGI